ncbi:hypothetical protein [Anaerosporobacter faecicola]|uniref:hypothetical protein n=1 Tax=Anaerosporobacter faecicola TaxID=2718714 RepID=UPI00143C3D69|nr:hypothetical protein [Anaerosporobacter faecicola]
MITWYDSLYMDDHIRQRATHVTQAIEDHKRLLGVYCIALASNEKNLFDIINVNELLFQHYRRNQIYIIGLAQGKESAKKLVARIIEDVYRETKDFKAREYFAEGGR